MKDKEIIYLDYAANTPVDKEVLKCFHESTIINMDLENLDLISFEPYKFYGLNGFGGLLKKIHMIDWYIYKEYLY